MNYPVTENNDWVAILLLSIVWAWAFIIAVPEMFTHELVTVTGDIHECVKLWPNHHLQYAYSAFLVIACFLLPSIALAYCLEKTRTLLNQLTTQQHQQFA